MLSRGDALDIPLHGNAGKEFLDSCGEDIQKLPDTEAAEIYERSIRLKTVRIKQPANEFESDHQDDKAPGYNECCPDTLLHLAWDDSKIPPCKTRAVHDEYQHNEAQKLDPVGHDVG